MGVFNRMGGALSLCVTKDMKERVQCAGVTYTKKPVGADSLYMIAVAVP